MQVQGWWGRGRVALAAASLIGLGSIAPPAHANVGGPDVSFGGARTVVVDVQQGSDVPGPIAALADGRTVGASAGVLVPGDHLRRVDAIFVRRLLLDGSPDPTFGVGGVATIPFPGRPVPTTLTVGLLGDVVVAVAVDRPRDGVHTALVALDPLGGSVVTDLGGPAGARPYHGVDALGRRTVAVQRGTQLVVERSLPGGIPDLSFGLGGTTTLAGALGATPRLDGLVVQPDGRAAAAVDTWGRSWSTPHDGVLVRLGATGAPDPAVPDRGLGLGVHAAYHAESVGLALDPAGRVLVAGPGLVRFLADGSVDPTFAPPDARADLHGVVASADHVFAVGPEHRHVLGTHREHVVGRGDDLSLIHI